MRDEIAELDQAFHKMAADLTEAIATKEEFLSIAKDNAFQLLLFRIRRRWNYQVVTNSHWTCKILVKTQIWSGLRFEQVHRFRRGWFRRQYLL
jgi:hypothetical protein